MALRPQHRYLPPIRPVPSNLKMGQAAAAEEAVAVVVAEAVVAEPVPSASASSSATLFSGANCDYGVCG